MATEILSFILFIDHCCIHDGAEQKEILIFVVHSLFTKLLITITSTSHDRHDHYSLLITHLIDGLCLLHLHLAGRRVDAVRYLSLDRYQHLASEKVEI